MAEREGRSYKVPDKPDSDDVQELYALTTQIAHAAMMREGLRTGWLAGTVYDPAISEVRTEVERATNDLQRALHRYERVITDKAFELRTRFAIWFDLNADDLESAVREGYKECAVALRPLLRDIKLRLDGDADAEQEERDTVTAQTMWLQKRVVEAMLIGQDE